MSKKKVLFVHHSGCNGGAPRSLKFLMENVDKDKYSVMLLCPPFEGNYEFFAPVAEKIFIEKNCRPFHGSTVTGMNARIFINNLLGAIPLYNLAQKIIKEEDPDIVHLNSSCLFMFAKGVKSVSEKTKVITHIREPLLDNWFGGILRRENSKYVDGYIAIDKFDLDTMDHSNTLSEVIYNFVDFKTFDRSKKNISLRQELNIPYEDVVFVSLARIDKANGILHFLELIDQMKLPKIFHFVFIGDEIQNNSRYSKAVRHKVKISRNNVYLLPFRTNIPELLSSCDVYLCPFTEPHFSRGIIEAAAMGVPSIGSDVGGVNELIHDDKTGFLYQNENELYHKLIILGNDTSKRKQMGENAYQDAVLKYNAKINTERTFQFYDILLNQN